MLARQARPAAQRARCFGACALDSGKAEEPYQAAYATSDGAPDDHSLWSAGFIDREVSDLIALDTSVCARVDVADAVWRNGDSCRGLIDCWIERPPLNRLQ